MLKLVRYIIPTILVGFIGLATEYAQNWDFPSRLSDDISKSSHQRIQFAFEQRSRFESRDGINFGKDANKYTELQRTRFGMTFMPAKWLMVSSMLQDSRALLYGASAPNSFRDSADLQESFVQLFPGAKRGFSMLAGRGTFNYGDRRLIGTSQWGNTARGFDGVRLAYIFPKARVEFLLISPIKVQIDNFNNPVMGDRIVGMYNTLPNLPREILLDAYWLQRYQNHPGGFTSGKKSLGTDHMTLNTFGIRMTGRAVRQFRFTMEGALQQGTVGAAKADAGAFAGTATREVRLFKKPVSLLGEYKYASGSSNPADKTHTRTFDQLYASCHDRFGHLDLFGWRNLHNLRTLETVQVTKALAVNAMYDSFWLASMKDSLYNGSGKAIATSAKGTAGRYVGQEADLFMTYKYGHHLFGAGYGYFFKGTFVRKATPGVEPTYAYLFHTYSF